MLKKRYNTLYAILFGIGIFACSLFILWILNASIHFQKQTTILSTLSLLILISSRVVAITVGRNGEVVEQQTDYPPKGINPIQAGCIIDGSVNQRDIVALFFYMAQKGYMRINEYELKKFEFEYVSEPVNEQKAIILLFNAIFAGKKNTTVPLTSCAKRIAAILPKIKKYSVKSISSKKNKEIADMTGKVMGFKNSIINNRGEKAIKLTEENEDYVFTVFPYAFAFSVTAKLARNFDLEKITAPKWYKPYGVGDNYNFDVVIYNSIVKNLPYELNKEVF